MKYPINAVHIHHFRSIRDCTLMDLRQINILIGRPNTGKTNILEALTLLAIPDMTNRTDLELKDFLRAQTPKELFFTKGPAQYAIVTSNRGECLLQYTESDELKAQLAFDTVSDELVYNFDASFRPAPSQTADVDTVIKRYQYPDHIAHSRVGGQELGVPYGHNLFSLLEENTRLQEPIAKIIAGTGIKIQFDKDGPKIHVPGGNAQPNTELHFTSLSASLQRLCFYLTAIGSNEEKLIAVDNLDAKIFPSFLVHLAIRMLENPSNQYLFSIHSYYMLIDLLEDGLDHVAIFNVYTKNAETHVYRLTDENLADIIYNGVDPFINNEHFLQR
jgi:hypothetical protein